MKFAILSLLLAAPLGAAVWARPAGTPREDSDYVQTMRNLDQVIEHIQAEVADHEKRLASLEAWRAQVEAANGRGRSARVGR